MANRHWQSSISRQKLRARMPHTFQLAERGETIKTIKIKGKFLSETMILPTNQHPIRWASQRAWRVRRRAFEDKHCPATRTLADLCKNKTVERSNQKNEYSIGERFAVTMMPKWWEPRAFGLPNCSVLNFFFEILACQMLFGRRFWMPASVEGGGRENSRESERMEALGKVYKLSKN